MEPRVVGRLASLWRYPVRSLRGEMLARARVSPLGIAGDRAYSVVDPRTGRVATAAKQPRRFAGLLAFEARLVSEPDAGEAPPPPVSIEHVSGEHRRSDAPDLGPWLAQHLGRPAALFAVDGRGALSAWERARRDPAAPPPPYPSSPLHLMTTASLAAAAALHPAGHFEWARFRPNGVIETGDEEGFLEAGWVDGRLFLGDEVVLHVAKECERCALPTLAQPGLAADAGILRTVVRHNRRFLGISCNVLRPGLCRTGDPVRFAPAS